jgi:hypothetical protein
MSKRKGITIYEKEEGRGWYADFRRLGGKLEATPHWDVWVDGKQVCKDGVKET